MKIEWLEDLIEMAQEHADHFSAAYAGYKPERHAHHADVLKQARAALAASQPEATVPSDAPRWQELVIQCLKDALKDVEAIGVELPRHGIDVLGYFINRLNAASQPEPVAPSAHECPPSLALRAWNALSEVDYEFDPPQRILDLMYELQLVAQGRAQPPADLKDAQRLEFLESLLNRTEFQNSKRPAEPVHADMHFHGDAGCSLYIRDLFGNVTRCGSAGTVRSTIDSAMLSSAPTGEKP